jgi:hypothetical protein
MNDEIIIEKDGKARLCSGIKDDSMKLQYDLIPKPALEALCRALMYGARKYGRDNWKKGIEKERLWAAAQRHLWAWKDESEFDPESGLNHLDHAITSMAFLISLSTWGFYGEEEN